MTDIPDADGSDAAVPHAEAVWARNLAVLWRRSSDRIVVLPPGASEPLLLEGTGAAVFELLESPASLDELAEAFASATGTSHEVIARDLAPFLARLADDQVLTQT